MHRKLFILPMLAIIILLANCSGSFASRPPQLADELVLYGWAGYIPQSILDNFTKEYGVKINYLVYKTQEEAVAEIHAGKVCDVLIMGNYMVRNLWMDGLLAKIDYHNVPNFRNVSANFRELAFDPGNQYSVMIEWGTAGLVIRTDRVERPIRRWADLWDKRYAGKIGLWALPRDLIGIALKSLGYSLNSENPAELEEALQQLLKLKPNIFFIDLNLPTATSYLISGQAAIVYGWSYDLVEARKQMNTIRYVLPEEGTILWGDNVTIPANSLHKYTAEIFLNYLLRPEVSAQITNEIYVATPNEAARAFIKPEILNDPVIFPSNQDLKKAEVTLPLSPEGQKLHDKIWERFIQSTPVEGK